MEIRYKLYPYPVLSSNSDDYIDSIFDSAVEVVREVLDRRCHVIAAADLGIDGRNLAVCGDQIAAEGHAKA